MKVKVISKLLVPEDKVKEVVPLFTDLRTLITKQPGYVLTEILRGRERRDEFIFITTWQSFSDWERWLNSEPRNKIIAKMSFIEERSLEVFDYGFLR